MSVTESQLTPQQIQAEIAEEFALFGDWSERYQYLIDLAKTLPAFSESLRAPEHLLKGCQSQVFVVFGPERERLRVQAVSDSSIVSGLIALVLRVYGNQPPQAILDSGTGFMEQIGLSKNLSMTRKNGLNALLSRIRLEASLRL